MKKYALLISGISILLIIMSIGLNNSMDQETIDQSDYENILQNGNSVRGKLLDFEILYNMSINGSHPALITYSYEVNGITKTEQVKVLDPHKVDQLSLGQSVMVKHLDNKSILVNFKRYNNPMNYIFLIIVGIFVLGGLPFLIKRLKRN